MQCNLRAAHTHPCACIHTHARPLTYTLAQALEPRRLMQLTIPVIPGGRPRDPTLPQGGGGGAQPLPRPAAGQAPPEQTRRAVIIVVTTAAAVVAVTPEVQRGAECASLAPRVSAAVLQAVTLDFVEQEVHLALHAEHLARAGLLDLLVADAPPAVLLLLLGWLGRVCGCRCGSV